MSDKHEAGCQCGNCNSSMVHLHVHTDMSLLDGAATPSRLVKRVAELGQTAVAMTDHAVMSNALTFYNEAKKHGVKPIIGQEAYLADASRHRKDNKLDRKPYHLVLLAKNDVGYRNLMKISSLAQLEGFYYRPRADWEILREHSEGLIVTSGCLASEIPQFLLRDNEDEAIRRLERYLEVFGDDFYLEVQYRLQSPDQHRVNKWLLEYGKRHNIRTLVTTDAHYVTQEDAEMHDTMLCIQTGARKDAPNRMRFDENTYAIIDEQTIRDYFGNHGYVVDNTSYVAEQCNVELDTSKYHLPEYPVLDGYTSYSMLYELCQTGLSWRYGSHADDVKLQERIEYELGIIEEMGFTTYFLVVWDICEYSRYRDIWWNVRGSGAGSLVAYVLGITEIDPIATDLYFERFLNPSRKSMPDIDLDFEDARRNELVDYLVYKYGDSKVAGIITFGTLSGKAAVKDVGRVLGVDADKLTKLTRHVVTSQGKTLPLPDYLNDNLELQAVYDEDPELREVWDVATQVQGYPRHSSTHPAGFIVSPEDITNFVPTHRLTGKAFGDNTPLKQVTQFGMEDAESLGLLKIDLLGLATLSVMKKACEYIAERHGHVWTIENIPYRHTGDSDIDGPLDEAFELLGSGNTGGVFQVEGSGLTKFLEYMKPHRFEHIVAALALYRPGPMGQNSHEVFVRRLHGEEKVTSIHPLLGEILSETYGLMVYQEQVMAVASRMFGYAPGDADYIRKAVGKKRIEELEVHYARFVEEGQKRGYSQDVVDKIWETIEYFAGYGFNKAHSADYAKVCVQTAFLKKHYLIEYQTALLQVYLSKTDKLTHYLDECRTLSIPVLPPSINYSKANFSVETMPDGRDAIRCGLMAVKHVGQNPVDVILEARGDEPFKSLGELVVRLDLSKVNSKALSSLIAVGAFSEFGDRWTLMRAVDNKRPTKTKPGYVQSLRDYSKSRNGLKRRQDKAKSEGMATFDMMEMLGYVEEYPDIEAEDFVYDIGEVPTMRELLFLEKEAIGFYITARPSDGYRRHLRRIAPSSIFEAIRDGKDSPYMDSKMWFGGEILSATTARVRSGKNEGKQMGFFTLQDWHDTAQSIDGVVFSNKWPELKHHLTEGNVVAVLGTLGMRNGEVNFVVDNVVPVYPDTEYE